MRNLVEPLYEVETIINNHMELIHKLADIANTSLKEDSVASSALVEAMSCIWSYLKPVHMWIRDQNPSQKEFYDELDKYIGIKEDRSLEVKNLVTAKPQRRKRLK